MRSASSELPASDSAAAALDVGLRYVSDATPGIRRLRRGKRFLYRDANGKPMRDARTIARIRSLAIPPAYEDVWICPDPRGHIQATGRDARGRKQYRYHAEWHAARNETKFERMLDFAHALPQIRKAVARDLAREGLPKQKVLAAVVRLLENTCIRIGNEEYARANDSFGLTTLRDRHVRVAGSRVRFEFRGKRGKQHRCQIDDRRLARVVAHCQAIPGAELFQYVDEAGERRSIGSGDVNEYLRAISGEQFSAKDFRTWSATLNAGVALLALGTIEPLTERRRQMLTAVDDVAKRLNNTRAVCRKFYIHPHSRCVRGRRTRQAVRSCPRARASAQRSFRRRARAGRLPASRAARCEAEAVQQGRVSASFRARDDGAEWARAMHFQRASGRREGERHVLHPDSA